MKTTTIYAVQYFETGFKGLQTAYVATIYEEHELRLYLQRVYPLRYGWNFTFLQEINTVDSIAILAA